MHVNKLPWFKPNGSVCIKLLLPIRLFLVILWPWPWITLGIFLFSWWSIDSAYKAQSVSCLQRIQSRFLSMWQYQHLPLIMVINCTKLYDPGVYSSLCILPTFSYYVTIRPWPLTTDLLWTLDIFPSCWSIVPSCKILEIMVQFVSCLQSILSCFPAMWQYDLDIEKQ